MRQNKTKSVLIITSSGGGGLLTTALAKEQEIRAQDPESEIIVKDMMKDWIWKWIGAFGIFAYNWNQKGGQVFLQTLLVYCQRAAEILFWPKIFFHVLKILKNERIVRIIDTQPLGTKVIIKALRYFHRREGRKITLEKVAIDLPTPSCQHFFRGVKSLSKKDREYISYVSIEPMLEEKETEKDFWKKYCNLDLSHVVYEKYPIRESFKKIMAKGKSFVVREIYIHAQSEQELLEQRKCFERGSVNFSPSLQGHMFSLSPDDRIMVVLLGSNPSERGAFQYVKETLKAVEKTQFSKKLYLFVFCGSYEGVLFQQITSAIATYENYPKNVSVIPMSFQTDEVIAPLFARANLLITKSGGGTAMELMAVAKGDVWIHSEAIKNDNAPWNLDELLTGIVSWEAGNARYLKEKMGAEIMTPERFAHFFEEKLQSNF